MKNIFVFLAVILLFGCNDSINELTDDSTFGFYRLKDHSLTISKIKDIDINQLELEETPWLKASDISFYDCSSHCIYLNKSKSDVFIKEDTFSMNDQPFVVVAMNRRCYTGSFHSGASSLAPTKPYIDEIGIQFYPEDVLHISRGWSDNADARNSSFVKYDLTSKNKLHEGLLLQLLDVKILSNSDTATVQYTYSLINKDTDDLYVLDPDRMGSSLFHYFTNGIDFTGNGHIYYSEYKKTEQPEPFDSWASEWFTKIKSGSAIKRTVTLKGYPHITEGTYVCSFGFSAPPRIDKSSRTLPDGRYWLGELDSENEININL